MELWNTKILAPPPMITCQTKITEAEFTNLMKTMKGAIDFFSDQELLHQEAALLSQFIHKLKRRLRSAKDMRSMEKIKQSLSNYMQVDLLTILKQVNNLMPESYQDEELPLPTKDLIDFILVRLQGLSKVLVRILQTSKIAANLIHKRIVIGQIWQIAMVMLGVTSRIYILSREVLKFILKLYPILKPYSAEILKSSEDPWLPSDYEFPDDLLEWLEVDWDDIETNIKLQENEDPAKFVNRHQPLKRFFNSTDDSDDDDEEEIT